MSVLKEERTPSEWKKRCLGILQEINPGYRVNKDAKGRFIEFIRNDDTGAFVSLNFLRVRDTYHLCFAISLTTKLISPLYHPLLAGSRFDNNATICRRFLSDLGLTHTDEKCPKGIWSSGEWRSNTLERLKRGFQLPEEYLYPYYRSKLHEGKASLLQLIKRAEEIVTHLDINKPLDQQMKDMGIDKEQVDSYIAEARVLDMLKIAKGGECWYGYGPYENTFKVSEVPIDSIIMNYLEVFISEKDRLSEIIEIVEKF